MEAERSGADLMGMRARAFPIVMGVTGVVVAALVAAMPQASLDLLMWRLWLPSIVSAATPPIGVTGRTLLAIAAMLPFVGVAVVAWMWRGRAAGVPTVVRAKGAKPVADHLPTIRRADAHPDAAPRRPIRAAEDLGPPLPIVTVSVTRGVPEPEQPLPRNLDQPLAAFDPISVPDVPREPVRAVAPLAPSVPVAEAAQSVMDYAWSPEAEAKAAAEEPVLSFLAMAPEPVVVAAIAPEPGPEVAPAVEKSPALADLPGEGRDPVTERPMLDPGLRRGGVEVVAAATVAAPPVMAETSISSLLDRLERGARKKVVPVEEPQKAESLDDTLVMLRRLAAG